MRIPSADRAVIDPLKLHGYLLSQSHPVGRFKAGFFVALGYSENEWQRLETDLRAQHLNRDAMTGEANPYGRKYEIRAPIMGPAALPTVRDGVPRRREMRYRILDVVVLEKELPERGLRRGDLGAVVQLYEPDGLEVEFVTASGRTEALVTVNVRDVRPVADDDLVAVRPYRRSA
jgi:hypothetical protein